MQTWKKGIKRSVRAGIWGTLDAKFHLFLTVKGRRISSHLKDGEKKKDYPPDSELGGWKEGKGKLMDKPKLQDLATSNSINHLGSPVGMQA